MGCSNANFEETKDKNPKTPENFQKQNNNNNNNETSNKNGKKENGIIKYDNGEYYKGEDKNGKRQGKGILY